ncbi:hypothetical protein Droror1_Dr00016676 [Drosera rotundifolia]
MGLSDTVENHQVSLNGTHVVRCMSYPGSGKYSPSWFDMRVFYVRVSNFSVDESTPEILTLHHIPLNPDTHLEVNGWRCSIHSDGVLSLLRRDRVDKQSEEATFVCTDGIRFTDSVKFKVCYRKELLLSGILDMPSCNGSDRELRDSGKLWRLSCETEMVAGAGFLKGNHEQGTEYTSPVIEVYVAGSFSGSPVILTKTLKLSLRNKHSSKAKLHAIPEHGSSGTCKDAQTESSVSNELCTQVAGYGDYKIDNEEDPGDVYWKRPDYMEVEDGELSWFNAGVRVGVGIGLGICLGVGIGVGLVVRSYLSTTRNFRGRLL